MKNRVYQQIVTAVEAVPDLVQDQVAVAAAEAVRVQAVVAVVAQEVVLGLEAAAGVAQVVAIVT